MHRKLCFLGILVLLVGCATTPTYDSQAKESIGKIVAKAPRSTRTQPTADSYNAGPALAQFGILGWVVADLLQKKTDVTVYEYRIRTEDGGEVSVLTDYFANQVGECVKLLESSMPTYPRFVSHDICQ